MTPDQPISLAVALVGSLLSLVLPRRFAIVPLALSMCLYPSMLELPPVNLSLTPQRVIAGLLLLRCVIQPAIRAQFRWRIVDTVALVYFVLLLFSMLLNLKSDIAINNRAGFFLSALVPFWCVRFLIVDKPSFRILLGAWLWSAVPLAGLGIYQNLTGDSPYFKIMSYGVVWRGVPNTIWDMRPIFGQMYFRASAPFLQFIMFGWFFALLMTPATNLFFRKRRVFPWIIAWLALPVGVASSISSGPMAFAIASLALAALFPLRRHWRVGYTLAAVVYIASVFLVNRSPMEFMALFGKDASSSWYRVGLVNYTVAGEGMKDHWLAGYGDIPEVYEDYHDLCIHWVWLLVVHGLMGFVGFYGFIAACAASMWRAKDRAESLEDQWLLWSLKATLLATLMGMLLTSLFSEMYFIYHMFLGMIANADKLVGEQMPRRVELVAEQDGRPVVVKVDLKPNQAIALVPALVHHEGTKARKDGRE